MVNSSDEEIILTCNLTLDDIPLFPLSRGEFSRFALSFDPQREPFNDVERTQFEENKPHPLHSLKVLRAYLYSWQRILNNKTYDDFERLRAEFEEITEWIRKCLVK
jgi:hypothetical protein